MVLFFSSQASIFSLNIFVLSQREADDEDDDDDDGDEDRRSDIGRVRATTLFFDLNKNHFLSRPEKSEIEINWFDVARFESWK